MSTFSLSRYVPVVRLAGEESVASEYLSPLYAYAAKCVVLPGATTNSRSLLPAPLYTTVPPAALSPSL